MLVVDKPQRLRLSQYGAAFDPNALTGALVGGLTNALLDQYDTVEVRTEATPPFTVNLRDATAEGPPSPITKWLKPTMVLTGKAGRKVIAPYGESEGSHGGPLLLFLTVVGIGFILGRVSA